MASPRSPSAHKKKPPPIPAAARAASLRKQKQHSGEDRARIEALRQARKQSEAHLASEQEERWGRDRTISTVRRNAPKPEAAPATTTPSMRGRTSGDRVTRPR